MLSEPSKHWRESDIGFRLPSLAVVPGVACAQRQLTEALALTTVSNAAPWKRELEIYTKVPNTHTCLKHAI